MSGHDLLGRRNGGRRTPVGDGAPLFAAEHPSGGDPVDDELSANAIETVEIERPDSDVVDGVAGDKSMMERGNDYNSSNAMEIEATPSLDQLAHLLQAMLDKVDGDPSRPWDELSEPERGFYRMCICRVIVEDELVDSARASMNNTG